MSGPADRGTFTKSEMMIVAAARELAGQHVCFVGVGLPNIAVNLAKRTVAPDLELVYEAGVFGARPARLPLSIGDPTIVTGATAVVSMVELFGYYLQRGLIDVGFLGAAQIDRFGNINTTVIGDYDAPDDAAARLGRRLRDRDQRPRGLRDHAPDRGAASSRRSTSGPRPGNLGGAEQAERIRREGGWLGRGPTVVVTDLGIYHFDDDRRDAARFAPSGRDGRAGPRHDRLGGRGRRRPRRDAPADRRGAAAHPRGARPGRRLHEVGRPQPGGQRLPAAAGYLANVTRNSSVPSSAIETMNPPMLGAVIE